MTERSSDPVHHRLDRIEQQLDRLLGIVDQAAPAVGMATDAVDELAAGLQQRGVDVDQRVQGALTLLDALSAPGTLEALQQVIDALPRLLPVVQIAADLEDTVGMTLDVMDGLAARAIDQGIDIEERVGHATRLAVGLTSGEVVEHLSQLIDAAPGLLSATRTGEMFGRSVDDAVRDGQPPEVGFWGLLRALREPEVQRAAGFAIAVARRVGARLPEHLATPHALPAKS